MSELLGPDGLAIPKTVCVEYQGKLYPSRVVNASVLNNKDPRVAMLGVLAQMGDSDNLTWLALMALAKDIYSRHPAGTREFQDVAKQLGLVLIDRDRNEIDIAAELSKI